MAVKKQRKKRGGLLLPLTSILLTFVILAIIGFSLSKGYPQQINAYRIEAKAFVDNSDKSTFVAAQNGAIYDRYGKIISEIATEKVASYMPYDEIPKGFTDAMVSTEDRKFFKHHGVDYMAIIRAGLAYLEGGGSITQGGSTITMQLARNIFLNTSQTLSRKVEEAFLARYLEKKYSKEEIMEFYLNNIYFANGYYGVKAASRGYFGCDPGELNISQIAFLCAIPNSPSYYDPLTGMNNTISRRNTILKNMLDMGYLEQEEYLEAATMDIELDLSSPLRNAGRHNYVDTYTYHCAALALMENEGFDFKYDFDSDDEREIYEKNYNSLYSECLSRVSSGRYIIYTSFDMELQEELQTVIDQKLSTFFGMSTDGEYVLQGAGVCIDNETGYVVAEVGGRSNQNFTGYTLNRVYQSYRQPGSCIKPLSVYAPLFEEGEYTPSSYVTDQFIQGGPKNASGSYYGSVTIREAVERSLNTVAWKLYEEMGPEKGLSYLKKMHFTKIVDADDTLATALGGFTQGVTPAELSAGYATLANDGIYREPTCVVRMMDYDGNTVYESDREGTQVYSRESARTMTDVLTGVLNRWAGTAYGMGLENGMSAAGKTGTTDDTKDGWFAGYTHYYTTGIWVGANTPQEVEDLHGSTYPAEIWQEYMNKIHDGLEPTDIFTVTE